MKKDKNNLLTIFIIISFYFFFFPLNLQKNKQTTSFYHQYKSSQCMKGDQMTMHKAAAKLRYRLEGFRVYIYGHDK